MSSACQRKTGATIIESSLVMVLLCVILFGILQVSTITAANEVLIHSAMTASRCATVGYDETMAYKAMRMAMLPNMGPKKIDWKEEEYRIRSYLTYASYLEREPIMEHVDEQYWDSLQEFEYDSNADSISVTLVQEFPVTLPFSGAIYGENHTRLSVEPGRFYGGDRENLLRLELENHSELYLHN